MKVSHCSVVQEKWVIYASREVYRDFGWNKLISSNEAADQNLANSSVVIHLETWPRFMDSWMGQL